MGANCRNSRRPRPEEVVWVPTPSFKVRRYPSITDRYPLLFNLRHIDGSQPGAVILSVGVVLPLDKHVQTEKKLFALSHAVIFGAAQKLHPGFVLALSFLLLPSIPDGHQNFNKLPQVASQV